MKGDDFRPARDGGRMTEGKIMKGDREKKVVGERCMGVGRG